MTATTKHTLRKYHIGDERVSITLPAIPGVTVTGDRDETAPRTMTVRSTIERQAPRGIALSAMARRRVEMFRQALREARNAEGIP